MAYIRSLITALVSILLLVACASHRFQKDIVDSDIDSLIVLQTTSPFVGSKNTKVIHNRDCHWVKTIKEMNRTYYVDLDIAYQSGYRACKNCILIEDNK